MPSHSEVRHPTEHLVRTPSGLWRGHLDRLRRASGLSWRELSVLTGLSWQRLRKLDRGDVRRVPIGTIMRVAVCLGCSCADVLPLLAARAPADCSAARWVAERGRARGWTEKKLRGAIVPPRRVTVGAGAGGARAPAARPERGPRVGETPTTGARPGLEGDPGAPVELGERL